MMLNWDEVTQDYDPENDSGTPEVSYTEWVLLKAIRNLDTRLDRLEAARQDE